MPDTVIKPLPKPWKIGPQEAREIEVRPPTVDDLVEAEKEAHPGAAPNAFSRALACLQLVRVGNFTGPFVPGHFKGMGTANWYVIRQAMEEADKLGEAEQPSPDQPS